MESKAKILIVDDEASHRMLLQTIFGAHGSYQVVTADNGWDALALAKSERPDVVLLDIVLPGCDGFAVCRGIKADPLCAHTKVIFVTALAQEADRVEAMLAGSTAFITKPFSPSGLRDYVNSLVNKVPVRGSAAHSEQSGAYFTG